MSRRANRHSHPQSPEIASSYEVRRGDRGLLIRPLAKVGPGRQARYSMLLAGLLGLAALGAGLAIGCSNYTRTAANGIREPVWALWLIPGGFFFFLAILAFAGFVKLVVTRNVAVLVGEEGTISYGHRRLVRSGEAVAVCLDRRSRWTRTTTSEGVQSGPRYELKWAHVYVVTNGGRPVEMPAPYFSNLSDWPTAEALAAALAEALRVPLTTELPPGPDPAPCPIVLRSRFAGVVMLVFGTVAASVGALLMSVHAAAAVTSAVRPPAQVEWWAGLPFLAVGGGFVWIGCGFLDWGWRRRLVALAAQLTLGAVAALLIHLFN